jgi:hypothetical protein
VPHFLGEGAGGAWYGPADYGDCETYQYSAHIGPPASAKHALSVTFSGWTAPHGTSKPKRPFRIKTDFVSVGEYLAFSPKARIPDCGR